MAAYLIGDIDVTDPETFDKYRAGVPATVAAYGGKYLVRGGEGEVIEGEWKPARLVVLEFESLAKAKEWYHSPEYSELLKLRTKSTNSNVVFVEGV